ncbi:hypothetical protein [Fibrobacter succinogenes]|uniref:Uncharacterized protein n=1 Tax=Fibrobacter succinogenes TaxID=833 RepID=A0A380S5H5_FIBSU|nr:hypothetical protein [Fibrobacter succinogenes]PWJ35822.1 hypothetical protein IE02_1883 [Fibrobacter succinogenes subsp. elongatus]SUQ24477.1 hypothetical protein SAMN05661053_1883 [Fibrobacter succinogenes]
MANLLDEKHIETGTNLAADSASSEQASAASSQTPSSARIKRMRGWLGVKSTSSLGGYDDGGGGVVYGEGHSGWNR